MATEKFIAFDENGDIFLIKGRILRYLPDTVAEAVKTSIRSALSVPASAEGLTPGNNLSDLSSAETSRDNLEVPSHDDAGSMVASRPIAQMLYYDGINDNSVISDTGLLSFVDTFGDIPCAIVADVIFHDGGNSTIIAKTEGSTTREWYFLKNSSEQLQFYLWTDASNHFTITSSKTLTLGKLYNVLVTYDGNSATPGLKLYINGVEDTGAISTETGTYAGMSNLAGAIEIADSYSSGPSEVSVSRIAICNWGLDTEAIQRVRSGNLGFADQWGGSEGGVESSNFSAGVDGYLAGAGTAAGNVDAIGSRDDNLRLTVDGTNTVHSLYKSSIFSAGLRYRIKFDFYIPSTNSHLDGIQGVIGTSGTVSLGVESSPTLDQWNTYSAEAIANASANTDRLLIYGLDGGVQTFQDAGADDVLYVRNIQITRIGTVLDLRADNFNEAAGTLVDISGNSLDATNNGATLIGGRKHLKASSLDLSGIQTSSAGLSSGEVYSNGGVLTIV